MAHDHVPIVICECRHLVHSEHVLWRCLEPDLGHPARLRVDPLQQMRSTYKVGQLSTPLLNRPAPNILTHSQARRFENIMPMVGRLLPEELPPVPPPVRATLAETLPPNNLDSDHLDCLNLAMSNLLQSEATEFTLAQIVDGLPTHLSFAESHYGAPLGHPVREHEDLCPDALDKTREFRYGLTRGPFENTCARRISRRETILLTKKFWPRT